MTKANVKLAVCVTAAYILGIFVGSVATHRVLTRRSPEVQEIFDNEKPIYDEYLYLEAVAEEYKQAILNYSPSDHVITDSGLPDISKAQAFLKEQFQLEIVEDEDEGDEDDDDGIYPNFEPPTIDPRLNPVVITFEDFIENNQDYDKVSLIYYDVDDILADEREEIIDNQLMVIGSEALKHFGVGSYDKNIVYVRNDNMSTDFEIVKMNKSYVESVLGYVETKEKRRPKKMRMEYE